MYIYKYDFMKALGIHEHSGDENHTDHTESENVNPIWKMVVIQASKNFKLLFFKELECISP